MSHAAVRLPLVRCKRRVQRPGSGRAEEVGRERPRGGTQPVFIALARAMTGLLAREGVMKQDLDFSIKTNCNTLLKSSFHSQRLTENKF